MRNSQIPVEDEEHLRDIAHVHPLDARLPVERLAGGAQDRQILGVKPIDERPELLRNGGLLHAARLEDVAVDVIDLAGDVLPGRKNAV